jgi:hypothetical protein
LWSKKARAIASGAALAIPLPLPAQLFGLPSNVSEAEVRQRLVSWAARRSSRLTVTREPGLS